MKVIRAGALGFCEGVRRAVEMAWRASDPKSPLADEAKSPQERVYTLGPLIHNSRVQRSLEECGIVRLEEDNAGRFDKAIASAPAGSTVIIRAHGVSPLVEAELRLRGLNILDATCPHVKASQSKARFFAEKGYSIFLAGEKNHAEITGILGCVESAISSDSEGTFYSVVANGAEAALAAEDLFRRELSSSKEGAPSGESESSMEGAGSGVKTVLIGQTTIGPEEYASIGDEIKRFFPDLEIINTICGATADRQKALRELCDNSSPSAVDAVIIAGGPESANTRRLLSLARELGKPAWLVETPEQLPPEIGQYETIGLCAGASTPDDQIDKIEKYLSMN